MFKRNRVQKKFKKEMKDIEKITKKQEKKGEGLFVNKIYKLNFYGVNSVPKKKWKKVLNRVFNFVAGAITLIFVIFGLIFICLLLGWGI